MWIHWKVDDHKHRIKLRKGRKLNTAQKKSCKIIATWSALELKIFSGFLNPKKCHFPLQVKLNETDESSRLNRIKIRKIWF
jgi:hypothetical protein